MRPAEWIGPIDPLKGGNGAIRLLRLKDLFSKRSSFRREKILELDTEDDARLRQAQ